MKRVGNVFPILISDENIRAAIATVNSTHRYVGHRKLNRTVLWVERTMDDRVKDLREFVENGFEPKPARHERRYDPSAGKYRDIYEPALWPDQYVHHMLVQAIQPILMRGMDYWCCGSIKKRGTDRGIKGIKRWLREDKKGTKYAAELDIHHFYQSLLPEVVMERMRQLIKDERVLDLISRIVRNGVLIGSYCSQWFANTVLQPLDHLIREKIPGITHNVRYMDNLTLFSSSKKALHRAIPVIEEWLNGKCLKLKSNWQVYRVDCRMVSAMGYRYDHKKIYLRKRNLLRLKRQLARVYKKLDAGRQICFHLAAGMLSRLGQLKHCDSQRLRKRLVRPGLTKILKDVVRKYTAGILLKYTKMRKEFDPKWKRNCIVSA